MSRYNEPRMWLLDRAPGNPVCPDCQVRMRSIACDESWGSGQIYVCDGSGCDLSAQRSRHDGRVRVINSAMLQLRAQAHRYFDTAYRRAPMGRTEAYIRLATLMGLKREQTHFSHFDARQCRAAMRMTDQLASMKKRPRPSRDELPTGPLAKRQRQTRKTR